MLNRFNIPMKIIRNRFIISNRFSSELIKKPKLRIVFGSQSGTAEAFANDLEFDAADHNFEAEVIDANEFSVKDLTSPSVKQTDNSITAFVMATYGEGEPTDNAKRLFQEIAGDVPDSNRLKSCNFAVFGLGNSHCFKDRFNVVGKALDARLNSLGAKRVLPIGLGDASTNTAAAFTQWKKQFFEEAGKIKPNIDVVESSSPAATAPVNATPEVAVNVTPPTPASSVGAVNTPQSLDSSSFPLSIRQQSMVPADRPILIAKVSEVRQLFQETNEINSAVHLTFDLANSRPLNPACAGVTGAVFTQGLIAGDHIGIFAPNSNQVIERFIISAGLKASDLDSLISSIAPSVSPSITLTLRQVLTWQIQLTGIVPLTSLKILQRWAREQSMTLTADHLQNLVDEYGIKTQKRGLDIATVLEMIPQSPHYSGLPLAALLKSLPPIAPRLYSLTHNPLENRSSVSLLSRLLRYRDKRLSTDRIVNGLCSSYLCERLKVSDEVAMFFRESSFHLPVDPTVPVIMVSGGSGIAPMMSFLEERVRLIKNNTVLGPALLYYGSRNPREYMMRNELVQQLHAGALSRLVVAFSSHCNFTPPSTTITSTTPYNNVSLPVATNSKEEILPTTQNITDIVSADIQKLVPLLQQGAYLYVCGGQGNFGNAVRNVINAVAEEAFKIEIAAFKKNKMDAATIATTSGSGSVSDVIIATAAATNVTTTVADSSTNNTTGGHHEGLRYLVSQKRYFEDLAD